MVEWAPRGPANPSVLEVASAPCGAAVPLLVGHRWGPPFHDSLVRPPGDGSFSLHGIPLLGKRYAVAVVPGAASISLLCPGNARAFGSMNTEYQYLVSIYYPTGDLCSLTENYTMSTIYGIGYLYQMSGNTAYADKLIDGFLHPRTDWASRRPLGPGGRLAACHADPERERKLRRADRARDAERRRAVPTQSVGTRNS